MGPIRNRIECNSEKPFNCAGGSFWFRGDEKKMRKSLKIASLAAVLFLALGAVVLAYAANQYTLATTDNGMSTNTWPGNCTSPERMPGMGAGRMRGNDFEWMHMLSENTTLSTVQGTVVSEVRNILIVNTGSSQIRVMLPNEWTVNSEVLSSSSLFNGTFAASGDTITLKVLENTVFSNSNFSVNEMLAYEAVNSSSAVAYAVLPFNIEPSS